MVRATKFSLGLASVVVLGLLSTGAAQLAAQEGGKTAPPKREAGAGGQERAEGGRKLRQEQREKLKKGISTAKVSLAAAIATVETETKGKVYRASYASNRENSKIEIAIGILVDDKWGSVVVDPDSGKAEPVKFDDDRAEGREGGEGRAGREGRDGKKEGDGE